MSVYDGLHQSYSTTRPSRIRRRSCGTRLAARVTAYSRLRKNGRPSSAARKSVISTAAVTPAKGSTICRK